MPSPIYSQQSKRPDIQLLRALAVVLVIVFHFSIWDTRGWLGVDVFFVISGYVITSSIIRRGSDAPAIQASLAFVYRRVRRLTPALFLMIALTTFFAGILQSPYDLLPVTIWTAIAAAFGLGNVAVAIQSGEYFSPRAEWNPLLHTWSLGVEEQFYMLFAILMSIGLLTRRRDSFLALVVVGVLSMTSLAAFLVGSVGYALEGFQTLLGFYSPVTRAWELGAGVMLALFGHMPRKSGGVRNVKSANLIYLLSILAISYIALSPGDPYQTRHLDTFTIVLLTTVAIHFGLSSNVLSASPQRYLIWLGNYSYSAYLWHWPIWVLTGVVIQNQSIHLAMALALTFSMTWASGRFVEPLLDNWQVGGRRGSVHIAVFAIVTVVIVSLPTMRAFTYPFPASQFQGTSVFSKSIPCDTLDDLMHEPCVSDFGHDGMLLVVGDSTALPYFRHAESYAQSRMLNLVFSSSDGCPAIRPGLRYPRSPDCVNWQKSVYEFTKSFEPEEVWIINRSAAYTTPSLGFYGVLDEHGRIMMEKEDIEREWREGLAFVLSASQNSTFVIFENAPEVETKADSRTLFNAALGSETRLAKLDRSQAEEARGLASAAHMALTNEKVKLLDPFEALCDDIACNLFSDLGFTFYADGSHLSPRGAESVIRSWLDE